MARSGKAPWNAGKVARKEARIGGGIAADARAADGVVAGVIGQQQAPKREMHTSAIHIPRDTYERLQDAAFHRAKEKRTRISVSALITEVVEEWLDARDRAKRQTD